MAAKKPTLPDAEIQSLADAVILAWELGEPVEQIDSLGATWALLPVRDENARVELVRYVRDADGDLIEAGRSFVSAPELGVDEKRTLVASRILAVASPA